MNGYEFAARARSVWAQAILPIIVVSGCTDEKVERYVLRYGCNDHLKKARDHTIEKT